LVRCHLYDGADVWSPQIQAFSIDAVNHSTQGGSA